jgi:hypothetical protein
VFDTVAGEGAYVGQYGGYHDEAFSGDGVYGDRATGGVCAADSVS